MEKLYDRSPSILVIGDVMLDCYISGSIKNEERNEDSVVYINKDKKYILGGAANVCATIRAMGIQVSLAGCIGNDENGKIILRLLKEKNISFDYLIISPEFSTITKTRLCIDHKEQILRIDDEKTEENEYLSQLVFQSIERDLSRFDVIVLSDYNKGVITEVFAKQIVQLSEKFSQKVIVDSKSDSILKYDKSYLIKANFAQFLQYCRNDMHLKTEQVDVTHIANNSEQILDMLNLDHLIITCADKGILYLKKGSSCYCEKALKNKTVCAVGSGDVVTAVISIGIAYGIDIKASISLANIFAGNLVSREGTSYITFEDIRQFIGEVIPKKVLNNLYILILLRLYYSNTKIVFTNGCFDWLHEGHLDLLKKSALLGDILIVAVNEDDSIKRLKGQDRPVYCLAKRIQDLVELPFVDFVIPFDSESDLKNIIEILRPNILVKGNDYRNKEITGSDFIKSTGGEVILIEHTYDISTTKKLEGLHMNK